MSVEDKLKKLIIERYGSIREFTIRIDIPYSTMNGLLTRGIQNSTVSNVLKVCEALDISADALANGKIIPLSLSRTRKSAPQADVNEILKTTREQLLQYEGLMFNGKPADAESIDSILEAMEIGMEIAKRKQNDKK